MADKEFKTKNGIIANGDITANGTLYLTLGSDAAGDIYTRAANGALTRIAQGANNTLLVINATGGHTYATVNSALLANNSVANQHISGANTIHGSVIVANSIGATQLVAADIVGIVTESPSITSNAIYDDQINPNHINTAAKFESTQYTQLRVNTASAVATAGVNEDELVVENAANAGISILTPNTGTGKVTFGDTTSGIVGSVAYEHSSDRFKLIAAGAQKLTLNSTVMAVNGTIAMTLGSDATGDVYVRSSSGTLERVAKGANGTYFGVNSTSGFQFTEFSIANDYINPSMINTAATFENTSFQVVTAGELIISNLQPEIYLLDTNGNTGFYGTRFMEHAGAFKLSTVNSTAIWQSDDYIINKNANGALDHHFYAQKVLRTTINSTALAVNTDLDVTGTGTFTSNLESNGTMRIIKATSGATATGDADEIIIENNANAGISILTPNTAVGRINFGDPQNGDTGYIRYEHSGDTIVLGRAAQDRLIVNSEVTINSSANVGGVLTAGELVISNTQPEIHLIDTDGNTSFNRTRILEHDSAFRFDSFTSTGSYISNDYLIEKNASGASGHRFNIAGTRKLYVNSSAIGANGRLDVTGAFSVNGAANVGGVLTAGELIISNSQPEIILTETDDSTGTRIVQSAGVLYFQALNASSVVIATSYRINTDAAGASIHSWWIGSDEKLNITGTTTTVNGHLEFANGNPVQTWVPLGNVGGLGATSLTFTDLDSSSGSNGIIAYAFHFHNITPRIDGDEFVINFSADNGSTWISAATAYRYSYITAAGAVSPGGNSAIRTGIIAGNATNESSSFWVYLHHPSSGTHPHCSWQGAFGNTTLGTEFVVGAARRQSAMTVNAVRFGWAANGFSLSSAAQVNMWGIRK